MLRCHYARNGCKAELPYDVFYKHMQACEYRKVRCMGCKKAFLRLAIEEHQLGCSFIEVDCQKCKFKFSQGDLQKHSKLSCLENQLEIKTKSELDMQLKVESLRAKV